MFLISLSILYLTFDSFLAQAAANRTDNSSEESSYAGSNQSDISLGSVDSDLEEEEIEDPEEQVTMPPKTPRKTPMKAAASATKKSQKNSSDDVLILAENLSKTSLSSNGISFTYLCPTLRFTCRDGDKDAALYEFHTPLPQQFLRHCKVIDGGMKLSILFGFPRVLTTEKAHKKVLGTEGIMYDPNLARVAARSSQVTHFSTATMTPLSTSLKETLKFVSCPSSALKEMFLVQTSTGSSGQLASLLFQMELNTSNSSISCL